MILQQSCCLISLACCSMTTITEDEIELRLSCCLISLAGCSTTWYHKRNLYYNQVAASYHWPVALWPVTIHTGSCWIDVAASYHWHVALRHIMRVSPRFMLNTR